MKINIENKRAADFHTIVLYSNPYLPTPVEWKNVTGGNVSPYNNFFRRTLGSRLELRSSDKILYKYNSTKISEMGFTEYDFKFFPEKLKYNDIPKIEYLRKEDKELLGPRYQDLYVLEESLFPTVSSAETGESNIGYFSSYIVGPQEIYILNLPNSVSRVEFYEDSLESNIINGYYTNYTSQGVPVPSYTFINNYDLLVTLNPTNSRQVKKPDLVVTLGPEFGDFYNNLKIPDPTWFYQATDLPWEAGGEESEELLREWVTLKDEKDQRKILYFVISHDITSAGQLNLSYSAWLESVNPNRNKWKYSLRNDESGKSVSPVYEGSLGFLYDGTSKTLVGTSRSTITPELDSRSSFSGWSPKRKYWKGDVVKIRDTKYISTSSGNIGNHPYYTNKWIKEEYIKKDIMSDGVQVIILLVDGKIPGEVNPSGLINLPKYTDNYSKRFRYISNPGFELDYLSSRPGERDMIEGTDYSKQIILNEDGTLSYQATVDVWTKNRNSGFLYFNYKIIPGKLVSKCGLIDYHVEDVDTGDFSKFMEDRIIGWRDFPYLGFRVSSIIVNDEEYNPEVGVYPGSKVTINISSSDSNYRIISAGVTYQDSSGGLVYSSDGISISTTSGGYTLIDSNYNYPTLTYDGSVKYPQYSFVISMNYIEISYLTNSTKISFEEPVKYIFYGDSNWMNRFVYMGNKSELRVTIFIGNSLEVTDTFLVGNNWSEQGNMIEFDLTRGDYSIFLSRQGSNVTRINVIIDEV